MKNSEAQRVVKAKNRCIGASSTSTFSAKENKVKEKSCNSAKRGSSACNNRRWEFLPHDILLSIAERLTIPSSEFIRFAAVNSSWRSAAKEMYPLSSQMPWLMLSEHSVPKGRIRQFFSPSENKIYELPLPEARGSVCCGSFGGWVATVGKDLELQLLNPFTRRRIRLPPLHTFNPSFREGRDWCPKHKRDLFLKKICLHSRPSMDDRNCVVVAFYGFNNKVAFARLQDRAWTTISCKWWPYCDAVFYKDRFYMVNVKGQVMALDIRRQCVEKIADKPPGLHLWFAEHYLVESSGHLLQVYRVRKHHETVQFLVYKLEMASRKWERAKSLGDQSLYVGRNYSMSVMAPDLSGCKSNCIYFTDNYEGIDRVPDCGGDMGVYYMEDGKFEPHYMGQSLSRYSPPLWVSPFMWGQGRS